MRDAPLTYEFIDVKLKRALRAELILPGDVYLAYHPQSSNLETIFIKVS